MAPATATDGGLIKQAVKEAVDAVASPDVRDRILTTAMGDAGTDTIPPAGPALRAFVEVHLRGAVRESLGLDMAEAVIASLDPIVEMAAPDEVTEVRASVRPSPTGSALDEVILLPPVLCASRDEGRLRELTWLLEGSTSVTSVSDAVDLLDRIQDQNDPMVVVLDCMAPAVHPATMATIAPDLPAQVVVILWGASTATGEELGDLTAAAERFLCCAPHTDAEDVATLIRGLFE